MLALLRGPIADGAARRAVQAFCRRQNLGAGAIDLPRACKNFPGPRGQAPSLPSGAQEVRPEGRPPRSPVQQALILLPRFQKCRPSGRHFFWLSKNPPRRKASQSFFDSLIIQDDLGNAFVMRHSGNRAKADAVSGETGRRSAQWGRLVTPRAVRHKLIPT